MEELTPHFTAWRVMPAGTREIIDALVAPSSRGSDGLSAALARWPGKWYWLDRDHGTLVLVRPITTVRPRWLLHGALILLTILCTLGAGAVLAGGYTPDLRPGLAGVFISAGEFFLRAVQRDWYVLLQGWSFALPLLAILLVHELGHYVTARRYAIDTSPPYFVPVPPTLSPIGSLGAFIRLRSPVVDRRQLLDVGAAGPLAGFVVAVAVLVWGYTTSERIPIVIGTDPSYVTLAGQPLFLGESLLTRALRDWLLPGTDAVHLSLPAFAGWVGVFITGLNLIPLSQLDGGHVTYGLLGRHQTRVAMLAVLALLWLAQRSPNWYVWVVFAFLVGGGRVGHPPVLVPSRAIPRSRWLVGLACVVVFALTFVPVPFE
ncbi:MAG TPA: site-2 protease family protein [Gemmatimonadales bacterium]